MGWTRRCLWAFYFASQLKNAVKKGDVPVSRLDDMVHRILRTEFAFGIVDDPPVIKPIDVEAGRAAAQHVEEQAIVLLKNQGILPLKKSGYREIAVIGSYADAGVLSGGGSAQVIPGVETPFRQMCTHRGCSGS